MPSNALAFRAPARLDAETIAQALACGGPQCSCGKRHGKEWLTHCPSHDDRNPSLTLSHGEDGKLLVYCHAECDSSAVIARLKEMDLWPHTEGNHRTLRKITPGAKLIKAYEYRDEHGELLFQVCRCDPKGFSQRRPDGNGGWIKNLEGVPRVLYRLPEVLKAETVYIVEGEKDADRLAELGLTATTNPMGAGSWREDYSAHLKGKRVIILPDNDKTGRDHAQKVAVSLHGLAASIKVVELPGLSEGGDVSDWLEAGGTMADLEALTQGISEWEPRACISLAEGEGLSAEGKGAVWPSEVMTGAAGNFAMTYSNYLETPPAFLYMGYLTLLGHIISGQITLESEIKPQPRLYTVFLGESADDRKSTAINKCIDFFAERASGCINPILGVGSAEGLAKALGRESRGILILDELKALIQKMRIDGSVLLPCVNTLFEANYFHNHTKAHDIVINEAKLSLLAASTLDTYRAMFTSQFTDIGFVNRLFVVIGNSERKFAIPPQMPESQKRTLSGDLHRVLEFFNELCKSGPFAMPIAPQAERIFREWYFSLERSIFTKRLDTYGHRLMPLLAVNEMERSITPEIAEKTVALLNYQLIARKMADPIDADNRIARLEENIRRHVALGPIKRRELEKKCNKRRVGHYLWDRAIRNLQDAGEIIFEHKGNIYRKGEEE